ncbi:MAG: pseudouridine-5'-phosphate glycosidase, partial [Anaerolineae bacterium]|nr:pseudouridine-5'-phosphate glycosidase [Anaerolineae bacterium]
MAHSLKDYLSVSPEVADALKAGKPVVALESTRIAHGRPWPGN